MRTYDESCALLDLIVGRCVRDAGFAAAVLDNPESALEEYSLNEDELDDFRALKARHRDEAAQTWSAMREGMATVRAHQQTQERSA